MDSELKDEFKKLNENIDNRFDIQSIFLKSLKHGMDESFALVHSEFNRVTTEIDGFVKNYLRLDQENVALRSRQDRLDLRMKALEKN